MRLPLFALLLCAGCLNFDEALETCRAQGRCDVDGGPIGGGTATGGGGTATGGGLSTGGGTTEIDAGLDAGEPDAGIDAGLLCDATTCPNGCCSSDGTCITRNTAAICGRAGHSCEACETGATCELGVCTGCKGCITGDRCRDGDVNTACGVEGAACQECAVDAGAVCIANACRTCVASTSVSSWQQVTMLATKPPATWGHGLTGLDCRAVLFGGTTRPGPSAPTSAETWVWNGNTWLRDQHDVEPPTRTETAMATINGSAILFGGREGATLLGDTWRYTPGEGWVQLTISGPTARFGHAMTFDKINNVVVLYGGTAANGNVQRDTWNFDGSRWSIRTGAGTNAPPSSGAAMSSVSGNFPGLVLFGGTNASGALNNQTWTTGGFLGSQGWQSNQFGTSSEPAPATRGGMAHTVADDLIFLQGSPLSGSEWVYLPAGVGGSWSRGQVGPIPERFGFAMTSTTGGILLFGGQDGMDVFQDTWRR